MQTRKSQQAAEVRTWEGFCPSCTRLVPRTQFMTPAFTSKVYSGRRSKQLRKHDLMEHHRARTKETSSL